MTSANRPIKICFTAPKAYPIFNAEVKEVFGKELGELVHVVGGCGPIYRKLSRNCTEQAEYLTD